MFGIMNIEVRFVVRRFLMSNIKNKKLVDRLCLTWWLCASTRWKWTDGLSTVDRVGL